MQDTKTLAATVQRNCDISDARHARDYSLCVYLLKMREYFRWERGYRLTEGLPRDELGNWVVAREQLWEGLEPRDFDCLTLADDCHDPFESEAVNRRLVPEGLVYSAGYGRFVKPHFFLGRLLRQEHRDGFQVFVATDEYARDLTAPPAMSRGGQIFIRRESLRRMLWEHVEGWRWQKRPENAMARAIAHYDFDGDPERALDQMTESEISAAVLHELGECIAGEQLGPAWSEMMLTVARSKVEIQARAVRDLVADCAVTLPALLEQQAEPSLHFFFANLRGMRQELFPRLTRAYEHWLSRGDLGELWRLVEEGQRHWQNVARTLIAMHRDLDDACTDVMQPYLESHRLS